ncbi:unnamed protein product [Phytophthora lilii]|uniref:Unnamed protein product n=1 Tax=Phytophthora lilii TaxID=2077276 RepID=A0A9W7CYZ8_9STRA|nr:unnamed protein product [Phytophthora lilii]
MSTKSSNGGNDDNEEVILELDNEGKNRIDRCDNLSFCDAEDAVTPKLKADSSIRMYRGGVQAFVIIIALMLMPLVLLAHMLGFTSQAIVSIGKNGDSPWVETYIHSTTENYTLFQGDSLYRRTTGFHGDLAFNVSVANSDPPNVLVTMIESFRFHDSHYRKIFKQLLFRPGLGFERIVLFL